MNRTVQLQDRNNVLPAIWSGDNSAGLVPEAPWYLLNREHLLPIDQPTVREWIVDQWTSSESMLGNDENFTHLPVLLAESGTYDASMLLLRAEMLDQVDGGFEGLRYALLRFSREINLE